MASGRSTERGRRTRRAETSATALARYARLEAPGEYLDGEGARAQDVIVSFGRATLTLSRFDDTPVAHWSLAGLRRLNGPAGDTCLRLAPGGDSDERLLLHDPAMIEAIRTVCADLEAPPPSRRFGLRLAAWGVAAAAALAGFLLVVLPALADALAPLVPPERERRLGESVAARVIPSLAGGAAGECIMPEGRGALDRLTARLDAEAGLPFDPVVRVWRSPEVNVFALPGGQVIVLSGLFDLAASPEQVAAVLAREFGHLAAREPLRAALRVAGPAGVIGLLAPPNALGAAGAAKMAEALLDAAPERPAQEAADAYAHALLAKAGLPAAALAAILERLATHQDPSNPAERPFAGHDGLVARATAARAADVIGADRFLPALSDADWIALRQICDQL